MKNTTRLASILKASLLWIWLLQGHQWLRNSILILALTQIDSHSKEGARHMRLTRLRGSLGIVGRSGIRYCPKGLAERRNKNRADFLSFRPTTPLKFEFG